MAEHKATLQFRWGEQGWREQYYFVDDNETPSFQSGPVLQLASIRAKMMAAEAELFGVRVSLVNEKRRTDHRWSRQYAHINDGNPKGGAFELGFMVRLTARDSQYRRMHILRGWPWDWIPGDIAGSPELLPLGVGMQRLTEFQTLMTGKNPQGGKFYLRVRDKTEAPFNIFTIDDVAILADRRFQIKTLQPLRVGDEVWVRGVKGRSTHGINGLRKVVYAPTVLSGYYALDSRACDLCPIEYIGGGTTQIARWALVPIEKCIFERWTGRIIGRPDGINRGRNRNKCCLK